MPRRSALTVSAVTISATAAVLAACSSSSGHAASMHASSPHAAPAAHSSGVTISLHSGMLVGAGGRTLYDNTVDTRTSISCTGACASLWPPVAGPAHAGSGLTASDLGTVKRPDGSVQATFNGHPLYYFAGDSGAGTMNGNLKADQGGTWHTVTMTGGSAPATSPASSPASSSGGGGYNY